MTGDPKSWQHTRNIVRIAHDKLGHFRQTKCYENLRNSFYWPNMQCDLEQAYIPLCMDCQQNKSTTKKPTGPLHPLPVLDQCCNSVAIDFIGPFLPDQGHDCIVTFTDCLSSDICIIPTLTTLTAE